MIPLAALPLLALFACGVVFHARDAIRGDRGALMPAGLAGLGFALLLAAGLTA